MVKRNFLLKFAFILLLLSLTFTMVMAEAGETKVFPGAEGFGIETPAGRGGQVIKVTTLDPFGPGSLGEAIVTAGPRIIVFEVGGVIDLKTRNYNIKEPYLTIAGQTAPYPGITIIRGGINVNTHDVLIKHLRVRPGDGGDLKRKGWEPDGITTSGKNAFNIVIDHVSATWAIDENLSASGERLKGPEYTSRQVTISNCLIAEALSKATHSKGEHSKGTLIHDFCRDIAVIKNFYAHNVDRNPYFKAYAAGVVVNNLVYNPGKMAIGVNYAESEWDGSGITPQVSNITVVGNVCFKGKNTADGLQLIKGRGNVYSEANQYYERNHGGFIESELSYYQSTIKLLKNRPSWPTVLKVLPTEAVVTEVTANAGAWPKQRDSIDARIIADFFDKKGKVINSQSEVGGYPDYAETRHTLTIPQGTAEIDVWLNDLARAIEN